MVGNFGSSLKAPKGINQKPSMIIVFAQELQRLYNSVSKPAKFLIKAKMMAVFINKLLPAVDNDPNRIRILDELGAYEFSLQDFLKGKEYEGFNLLPKQTSSISGSLEERK